MSRTIKELEFRPSVPDDARRYPIVLIGAGAITDVAHLPAYQLANFEVHGVFDVDHDKAKILAKKWHIPRVFQTLEEACSFQTDGSRPFIFDLALPPDQFIPVLKQIPKKSHILLQKPMGETGPEARAIANICQQRQLYASVNFQLRYAPHILALKDAIRRGWLGDRLTTIEFHVNVFMPWSSWPFLANSPRIEPSNHSVHYVDLVRDLVAPHEASHIHCRTSKHISTPQLSAVRTNISLAFDHDPDLYVNIYTNHAHRWGIKNAQSYLLVEGTKGAAKAQLSDNLAYAEIGKTEHADYLQVGRSFDLVTQ